MIGRVTVAYAATGVTNDSSILYVLITSPPAANPTPGGSVNYGNGQAGTTDQPAATRDGSTTITNTPNIYGLYKSGGEETLGITAFTHVQVRDQQTGQAPDESAFIDINFSNVDASNSGVLVVDPTDPNVVYVGGSEEYGGTGGVSNVGLIRIDTGNMIDTSYNDGIDDEGFLNDGDDRTKQIAAYDPVNALDKFHYPTTTPQGYLGEGVSWLNVATGEFNNQFRNDANQLPPNVTSVAIDAQGRIIFGTEQGLYRAVYQGTGYDFTSGGRGIVAQGGFSGTNMALLADNVPTSTITITPINGNLQISDLTSVAIDPSLPGTLYTTQYNTGAAVTSTSGSLTYTSSGLASGEFNPVGPGGFAGIPDGDQVVVAQPDPSAPAGTVNTIYEIFAYGDVGTQEAFQLYSSVQGGAFNSIFNVPTSGLPAPGTTGAQATYLPVLAIDPDKIATYDPGTGQTDYLDGLLLGTNQIYVSRTSGAQFTSLTGGAALSSRAGSRITAANFAQSNDQVIWAATNLGEVFVTVLNPASGGYAFQERDAGLPIGAADSITSITVAPTNSNVAYITENGPSGSRIFETVNDGLTWKDITGNLPAGAVFSLVTDSRSQPGVGAPIGHLYVGTATGVYVSVDNGAHWTTLGIGLPHVPVVDLEFSKSLEILVAGTEGRGAFEISTNEEGAHVVSVTPATPVNPYSPAAGQGPLSSVTVTFNESIASFPLSAVDSIVGPNGAITPLSVTNVSTFSPGFPNPDNVWQITFAPQTADGVYTITIGPDILDQLGHEMDQNQNGIDGEAADTYTFNVVLNSTDDGDFVSGQYHDEFNRAADTNGFETILAPIDAARNALLANYANLYVVDVGRPTLVQDLYGPSGPSDKSIIGVGDLLGRAAGASEINTWLTQLQNGLSYEQIIVSLAGSSDYFSQAGVNGNDANFVNKIYNDLLNRNPNTYESNSLFVPQLVSAESTARTQDARALLGGQAYQTLFIQNIYQEFLNRAPSNSEITAQLNLFNQGYSQEQIIAVLLGTPEYYTYNAPRIVGQPASNATLVQAMYDQLFPGYSVSQAQVNNLASQLNSGALTATQLANILDTTSLYRFGTPSTTGNSGLVYTAYETYLNRAPSADELSHWELVYANNPFYRTEDLDAAILGSGEYFADNTTASTPLPSQDQQFADALYKAVLGATNPTAESTRDLPFLAAQESAARNAVAQAIVGSPEYKFDVIDYIYEQDLGRLPTSAESLNWEPIIGTNGVPGGPNGDEQLIEAIFQSPEYFTHVPVDANYLHTNYTWLESLYVNLDVAPNAASLNAGELAQAAANLSAIDLAYAPARLTAIQAFQGSAEYYVSLTVKAYSTFLNRAPSAAEITFWIGQFTAGETQEQQIASLLSSPEFYALAQDTPKGFVDLAYKLLFPGYTATQNDENAFVPGLNAGTVSRLQVATILVNSFLYRFGSGPAANVSIPNNGFIERAYQQYLGRAIALLKSAFGNRSTPTTPPTRRPVSWRRSSIPRSICRRRTRSRNRRRNDGERGANAPCS